MSISRRHQRLRGLVGSGSPDHAWESRKSMLRGLMDDKHAAAFQVFAAVVRITRDQGEFDALLAKHGVDLTHQKRHMERPTTIPGSMFRKGPIFSRAYGPKAQIPDYQTLYTQLPYTVREGEHLRDSNAAQDAQRIIDRYLPGVQAAMPHLEFNHENSARTEDFEVHFQFAVRPANQIDRTQNPVGVLQPLRLNDSAIITPTDTPGPSAAPPSTAPAPPFARR
ncbi:MAG: hypothetical protein AAF213_00785 [Pseudomonadota bacterium]